MAQWVFRNQKHAEPEPIRTAGQMPVYGVRSQHDVYAVAGIALENTASLGPLKKSADLPWANAHCAGKGRDDAIPKPHRYSGAARTAARQPAARHLP